MGGEGEGDILTVVFLRTRLGTVIWINSKNDGISNFQGGWTLYI